MNNKIEVVFPERKLEDGRVLPECVAVKFVKPGKVNGKTFFKKGEVAFLSRYMAADFEHSTVLASEEEMRNFFADNYASGAPEKGEYEVRVL